MKALYLLLLLTLTVSVNAFCQVPPTEFMKGLQLYTTNQQEAKKEFLIAAQKDSLYHGTYHFLGVIALNEHKSDSAIWYFKKSIRLNTGNINHTKELTYVRLINAYTYQHDFQNAFAVGWEACKLYPDNKSVITALRDLCVWSFYIKYDHLDPSYLSTNLKDEYIVNSIDEEYMILRKIRVNDESLAVSMQSLVNKNNASYDVINCTLAESKKPVTVNFKISWDMNKDFGGKPMPTQTVIADAKNPIYERAGAMVIADNKTDIKTAIAGMMK